MRNNLCHNSECLHDNPIRRYGFPFHCILYCKCNDFACIGTQDNLISFGLGIAFCDIKKLRVYRSRTDSGYNDPMLLQFLMQSS